MTEPTRSARRLAPAPAPEPPPVLAPAMNAAQRFVMVGERTNVTGSAKFRKSIVAGDFEAALDIAREQVENGARIIDVNMDEAMLDSGAAMVRFLNLIAAEPDICRVPVMIDSSKWSVIEAGLKCVQGKAIVNSISLKEGEAPFVAQGSVSGATARRWWSWRSTRAGQADTVGRKAEICARAYRLLTGSAGVPPQDIVFDPNIFAVATGIEAHDGYGVAFIEATRRIKAALPGSHVSGGLSNLSFSFRGNEPVRRAMHSVFLYHAIPAGLDMAIVNAGQLDVYDEIDPLLRERVEDVVLNRRPDATDRLLEIAGDHRGGAVRRAKDDSWRDASAEDRLIHAPGPRNRRPCRGGRRGGAPQARQAARRDRGAADGRHVRRRRPVRRRQDVPAPGRQERPGHEEGGGLAGAVHGSGKEPANRRRRPDRDRDREGRRARHRQEYRRRRPALQRLRGDRPRGHGPGRTDPRYGGTGGRGPDRPERADHAQSGGNAPGRRRDGPARHDSSAADRRRNDQPDAHGGEDRARL